MFFILIFASGGISSGSLCTARECAVSAHLSGCCTTLMQRCTQTLTSSSSLKTDATSGFFAGSDGVGSLGFWEASQRINVLYLSKLESIRSFATKDCSLTVAPSLMDIGFAFFPIWLLMLKPILGALQGAAGLPEDSASSSDTRC